MATGFQGTAPSPKFCEIVRIGRLQGRRHIEPHEVTLFFKYKSGREGGRSRREFSRFLSITLHGFHVFLLATFLVFEVQGGTIFDLEGNGRQRRLTIVTNSGLKLGITRNTGGGKQIEASNCSQGEYKFDPGFQTFLLCF